MRIQGAKKRPLFVGEASKEKLPKDSQQTEIVKIERKFENE